MISSFGPQETVTRRAKTPVLQGKRLRLFQVEVATKIEKAFIAGSSKFDEPTLTAADLRKQGDLPAAGRDHLVLRAGPLLEVEPWGWSHYSSGDTNGRGWSFGIRRDVRKFRGVQTLQEYWQIAHPSPIQDVAPRAETSVTTEAQTIFLVHGHDAARHEVARFIERVVTDANVVILGEQASKGRTVIEKFEAHSATASFAVVLLTPDDIGRAKSTDVEQPRARQNVVFELGYFFGRLGRDRVVVLNKGGVEQPSDVAGIVYISYPDGNWKMELARELREHFNVDLRQAT
jgi:predicted nucleotide-binding protein